MRPIVSGNIKKMPPFLSELDFEGMRYRKPCHRESLLFLVFLIFLGHAHMPLYGQIAGTSCVAPRTEGIVSETSGSPRSERA